MKKRTFIRMLSFLAIAAMLLGMAGCNTSAPGAAPASEAASAGSAPASATEADDAGGDASGTTIQFWCSMTGSDGEIFREILDRFNAENEDGITVEMDIMPAATLNEKLPQAISTGTGPDMVFTVHLNIPLYVQNDQFMPIDDFFEVTGNDKSDYDEAILDSLSYEGSLYMTPTHWYTSYLYWNKDMFEAAGLDPDTPPDTWEEVAQFAEQLTNPDNKQYGVGLAASGGLPWYNSFFIENGGDVIDTENKTSLLDSPENLASLEFVQDLANRGLTPVGNTGADLDNLMMAGQLAMQCNGPWLVNGLKENEVNFGVASIPAGTATRAGLFEAYGFAVPTGTPENEKLAAYKFMDFWNSPDTIKEWALRNGFPPHLKSVAADPEVQADEIITTFSTISEYGVNFGEGITSIAAINDDILFPMIENVLAGQDCQTELTNASNALNEALANEK